MSIAVEALTGHLLLPARERTLRADIFAPAPRLRLSEWADAYRQLTSDNSAQPGQWHSFPFQREIMDVLGAGRHRRVVAMLPSQVAGKTEIAINLLLQHIHLAPCPMMLVTFNLDMARKLSKKRIGPAFRMMDVLHGKLIESGARREKDDTILYKSGPGWSLGMVGANSPGGLAQESIRILVLDEVDRYPPSAGDEGDVIAIAEARTTGFTNRIIYVCSTPTLEETSRIDKEYRKSDSRTWRVPCPSCNHPQSLEWGGPEEKYGLKWEKDAEGKPLRESVRYLCVACGSLIEEKWKHQMNEAGTWVAAHPGRDIAGFQCTCLVSPIWTWADTALDWYDKKDDPEQTKTFVNTRLCRTYSPPGARADTVGFQSRRIRLPDDVAGFPIVPNDAGLLTMSVDVQLGGERGPSRLECQVSAWGAGEQEWKLGVWRFLRDTRKPAEAWQDVERLRTRGWLHESGATLFIRRTAVDSGNEAAEVYEYVRPHENAGVMAVKGSSELLAQPLAKSAKRSTKYKVLVWTVGTIAVKDILFGRLSRVTTAGPGYIQFSQHIDDDFIAQFGNERASYTRKGTQSFRIYERIGDKPNEAIDLSGYNIAALYSLGPAIRKQLAGIVQGVQERGAKEKAEAAKQPPPETPDEDKPEPVVVRRPAPRRSGWVTGWKNR